MGGRSAGRSAGNRGAGNRGAGNRGVSDKANCSGELLLQFTPT